MNGSAARAERVVGVVVPIVIAALNIAPWLIGWSDLPDRVATHFALDGVADGSLPLWAIAGLHVVVGVVVAVAIARAARVRHSGSAAQIGVLTFVGVMLGWIAVSVVWVNHGAADWHEVSLGVGWVAGAIGAATGMALGTVALANTYMPGGAASAGSPTPVLDLGDDERAAWFGSAHGQGFLMAAAAEALVGTVVLIAFDLPVLGIFLLALGALLATFASVHVAVSRAGVRVHGVLPWPHVRFRLDAIERAEAIDLRPSGWGGWGYRGSVRLAGRAAWVVRAGPALVLTLTNGRQFAVTVDDADEVAAVVNGLRAQPGATPRGG